VTAPAVAATVCEGSLVCIRSFVERTIRQTCFALNDCVYHAVSVAVSVCVVGRVYGLGGTDDGLIPHVAAAAEAPKTAVWARTGTA
jgi:hypothetical protein